MKSLLSKDEKTKLTAEVIFRDLNSLLGMSFVLSVAIISPISLGIEEPVIIILEKSKMVLFKKGSIIENN